MSAAAAAAEARPLKVEEAYVAGLRAHRKKVEEEHGRTENPITGEVLDVMEECVKLRLGSEGYGEVLTSLGRELSSQTVVWVAKEADGEQEATIIRANGEGSYDVSYTVFGKKEKQVILKDVGRERLAPQSLLVVGEPAAGKSTFCKQLVTYCARHEKWLVPVLVRVADLSSSAESEEDMVWARIGGCPVVAEARRRGQLLVVLDGYDESGDLLRERLDRELALYSRRYHQVVVTSRETARASFATRRFRRIEVSRLDATQQKRIVEARLPSAEAAILLKELSANAALARMAENPLLLEVTASVLKTRNDVVANRSRIYAVALDSMLRKDVDRGAFRRLAWTAHTRRLRDMEEELVSEIVPGLDLKKVERGQFPAMAYTEGKYRFSHLTFQEFLAAEYARSSVDPVEFQRVVGEPRDLARDAWWQTVLEMFCDLAPFLQNIGNLFLVREDNAVVLDNLTDKSANCVAALLRTASPTKISLRGGSLSSLSGFLFPDGLAELDLSRNNIGPDCGIKTLPDTLQSLNLSENKLMRGNIVDASHGEMLEAAARSMAVSTGRRMLDSFFQPDTSWLEKLETILPLNLRVLDVRSNGLNFAAGLLLYDFAKSRRGVLETICGIPVGLRMRNGAFVRFEAAATATQEEDVDEEEFSAAPRREAAAAAASVVDASYLETGGAVLLAKILLDHPQPLMKVLSLRNQRLPTDAARAPELFALLGDACLFGAPSLRELDVSEWWDAGLMAGRALGSRVSRHPTLERVKLGVRGVLELRQPSVVVAPKSLSGDDAVLLKNVGAGCLAECLSPSTEEVDLSACGVGAEGLVTLCGHIPSLRKINGLDLDACVRGSAAVKPTRPLATSDETLMLLSRVRALAAEERDRVVALDLADCNMSSKSHVHAKFPFIGTTGNCDGGCGQCFRGNTDRLWRCDQCDYDECSACHASPCPMVFCAETVVSLPNLRRLSLARAQWQGQIGRSSRDVLGYEKLGAAFEASAIEYLDLGRNHDSGPGFARMVSFVARMPKLRVVKLSEDHDFRFDHFLTAKVVDPRRAMAVSELLLLAHLLSRNLSLRVLDLSRQSNVTSAVAEVLRESLLAAAPKLEVVSVRANSAVLRLDLTAPEILASRSSCTNLQTLAPLFDLVLRRASAGNDVVVSKIDFSNLDFGDEKNIEIGRAAAKWLLLRTNTDAGGSTTYNNSLLLGGELASKETIDLSRRPIMAHGVVVLAETLGAYSALTDLDLAETGLSGAAAERLFQQCLLLGRVARLDVSRNQLFGLGGLAAAGDFLGKDRSLRVLRMQRVNLQMHEAPEFERFSSAMATNTTLAELDLRSNAIPRSFEIAVRRCFEKRPLVAYPLESKLAFLLCPRARDLPRPSSAASAASLAEIDDSDHHVLPNIFSYLGDARILRLDSHLVAMMQVDPTAALDLLVEREDHRPDDAADADADDVVLVAEDDVDALLEPRDDDDSNNSSSVWARVLFMPDSEQLVDRLILEDQRLDEAARAPDLLVRALRHPRHYPLALRMLRDWGARVANPVRDALLADRNALWFEILVSDAGSTLADALCARHPDLEKAAASEDLLVATLSKNPVRDWRKALQILDRGAVVTPTVRDVLLEPVDLAAADPSTPFHQACDLRGAVVLESHHPYRAIRVDDYLPASLPGASRLCVKFDPRSRTLDRYAYVTLHRPEARRSSSYHALAGPFSRDAWPGVNGEPALDLHTDAFTLRFSSDGDQNSLAPLWGWKLVAFATQLAPSPSIWSTLNAHPRCRPLVHALAKSDPSLLL